MFIGLYVYMIFYIRFFDPALARIKDMHSMNIETFLYV